MYMTVSKASEAKRAERNRACLRAYRKQIQVMYRQIEASTSPPPLSPLGIPRAFDTFAIPGRTEFDYQSLPGGGEFDPHVLGVGNLNCTLDFMLNR